MAGKDNIFEKESPTRVEPAAASRAPSTDGDVARALVDLLDGAVKGGEGFDFGRLQKRFVDAGMSVEFRSWMTRKPNLDVSPARLRDVLGEDELVVELASRAGIDPTEFLKRAAVVLPRVVRDLTPFGEDDPRAVRMHLQGLRKRIRV